MKQIVTLLLSFSATLGLILMPQVSIAQRFTVNIFPQKDNTIFAESNTLSNGAGKNIFVGKTEGNLNTDVRRGLVKFDVSAIPTTAVIEQVTLKMAVVKAANTLGTEIALHKVLSNWGEGASVGLGKGAAAQTNDATWKYTFYSSTSWTHLGGDFEANPVAIDTVFYNANDLKYGEWATEGMKTNVRTWINTPATNFGWILIGAEDTDGSAKRFSSKEETVFPKPTLTITYSIPVPQGVILNEINPKQHWLELYNPSESLIDLTNYWLVNGVDSVALQHNSVSVLNGNLQLDSNKYVVVKWNKIGVNDGEITLFNKTPTSTTAQLVDYCQYGTSNHLNATKAVTAQVWDTITATLNILSDSTKTYAINPAQYYPSGKATNSLSWLTKKQTPSYKNKACPTNLVLTGNIVGASYSSLGQLQSTGTVLTTTNVKFSGENYILLLPSFLSEAGSLFETEIAGCVE